jgi:branched-chain amino acid transport system ATP-binding protein
MLRLEHVSVAYGKHEALHDVSLDVEAGRTTVILGANGAGKTTLLKAIAGMVRARPGGRILFEGRAIEREPTHRLVAAGIALVPEGRRLFADMTVMDNLRMGSYTPHARAKENERLEKQFVQFPRLAERRNQLARTMSGGEQQMLAIARALMSDPKVLLLDEPSLGLAPALVKDLFAALRRITDGGQSVILVEQNVHQSLRLAHRVHVLENGHLVRSGLASEIQQDAAIRQAYLGLPEKSAPKGQTAKVVPEKVRPYAGGFSHPFSRAVAPRAVMNGHLEERSMPQQLNGTNTGGFHHPGARSLPGHVQPTAPQKPTVVASDGRNAPAATRESIPTSGGFVNPHARPGK